MCYDRSVCDRNRVAAWPAGCSLAVNVVAVRVRGALQRHTRGAAAVLAAALLCGLGMAGAPAATAAAAAGPTGSPVRPVLAGPTPPPIPGPGINNAALATRGPGGVPACFQTAQSGSNTAQFSYQPAGGPGGAGAETIRMTGWSSGDAKLLPTLDLGPCAPPAQPGQRYSVAEFYRSSQPVRFDLYYRTTAGNWVYWTTSSAMPAADGEEWAQASWDTPAVPRGATAISFGLAIGGNGTVSVSRYSLQPVRYTATRLFAFGVVALILLGYFMLRRRLLRRRAAARAEPGPEPASVPDSAAGPPPGQP
jgi:hypothetical protein